MAYSKRIKIAGTSVLTIFSALVAMAQTPVRIMRIPAPIWNTDAQLANKPGAYFDPKANQLVVIQSDATSTSPKEIRYDIPNGAHPTIGFSMARGKDGRITYTYSLQDTPRSLQVTQRFSLVLPAHDSALVPFGSTWTASFSQTSFPDRTATVPLAQMRLLTWSNPAGSDPATMHSQLESAYLPGFVDAFVEGRVNNPLTADVIAVLPKQVAETARHFLLPGVGSYGMPVLGPLFRPDTSTAIIAANFQHGLSRSLKAGDIREDSAYAKELLAALERLTDAGGVGTLGIISATPSTPLEQQISVSIGLALE